MANQRLTTAASTTLENILRTVEPLALPMKRNMLQLLSTANDLFEMKSHLEAFVCIVDLLRDHSEMARLQIVHEIEQRFDLPKHGFFCKGCLKANDEPAWCVDCAPKVPDVSVAEVQHPASSYPALPLETGGEKS